MSFFGNTGSGTMNNNAESTVVETFLSTANQKVFTLKKSYLVGQNKVRVYISGVPQFSPTNFTETSPTTITLVEAIPSGLSVVIAYEH